MWCQTSIDERDEDGTMANILNDCVECTGNADVINKVDHRQTALMLAARNGHVACVKCLLATGKIDDINKEDEHRQTALMLASFSGSVGCVKYLLDTGKVDDINKEDSHKQTALLLASRNGHVECVKYLVDTGKADINREDEDGRTTFMLASLCGSVECVKYLLDTGKIDNINKEDTHRQTSLMLASRNGHVECVKCLLDTGKINDMSKKKDRNGNTAFMLAAIAKSTECLRCFLDIAVMNEIPTREASQDISSVSMFTPNESITCFTYVPGITWKSPYMDDRDQAEQSILNLVVARGAGRCVTCLLLGDLDIHLSQHSDCHHDGLEDAELHIRNYTGRTALMEAASDNEEECVDYILQYERIRFHTLVVLLRNEFARTNQISLVLYKKLRSLIWKSDQVECFLQMMCEGSHIGRCVDFLLSTFICQMNGNGFSAVCHGGFSILDSDLDSDSDGIYFTTQAHPLLLQYIRIPLPEHLRRVFINTKSGKKLDAFLSNGVFDWSWYPKYNHPCWHAVAQSLVVNGYSPGLFEWRGMPSSPLHHAFTIGDDALVRYLVANLYLTSRDIEHFQMGTDLRDQVFHHGSESLKELHRKMFCTPWKLESLSLVKISTLLECKVRKANMAPIDDLPIPNVFKKCLSFNQNPSKNAAYFRLEFY